MSNKVVDSMQIVIPVATTHYVNHARKLCSAIGQWQKLEKNLTKQLCNSVFTSLNLDKLQKRLRCMLAALATLSTSDMC